MAENRKNRVITITCKGVSSRKFRWKEFSFSYVRGTNHKGRKLFPPQKFRICYTSGARRKTFFENFQRYFAILNQSPYFSVKFLRFLKIFVGGGGGNSLRWRIPLPWIHPWSPKNLKWEMWFLEALVSEERETELRKTIILLQNQISNDMNSHSGNKKMLLVRDLWF